MKRLLTLLLSLLLCVGMLSGAWAAEEESSPPPELVELVVGTPTEMSGYFLGELWGNNTADMDVRALIHGYNTVAWERDGNYGIDNTVVKEVHATEDQEGNKTYRFVLHEDLVYNDGTPITARDYVFSALLISSPEIVALGALSTTLQHIAGFADFQKQGGVFSGLRLLGEYEFSMTIDAAYLPYYYELMMVSVTPYPIGVIAPECAIKDDGRGAYISGPFSEESLEETIKNPDTGYLYMPQVTSGPYTLVNFNRVTKQATLESNPLFKGNFEGQKPSIDRLIFCRVDGATMMDQLKNGEVDLINKVSSGTAISKGLELVGKQQLSTSNYLRSGMTFLSFACEMDATRSARVRRAVAMCVDSEKITEEYLLGYGMPVYGYYGYGQWMAAENQEKLLELAAYSYNLDGAVTELEEDGWTLNAEGEPYDGTLDTVRYRLDEEGELEELFIRWARPEASGVADMLQQMLEESMPQVGFRLEVTELSFVDLLSHYYRQVDRTYNMFSLASNFTLINDPYYSFHTGDEYQGVFNTTGIKDEHLMELALEMREVNSEDNATYLDKWLAFQSYWAEILPMVPLYSNIYFDFHRTDLHDYYVNSYWSWGAAILYAYVGEERDTGFEFPEGDDLDTLQFDDTVPAPGEGGGSSEEELESITFLD